MIKKPHGWEVRLRCGKAPRVRVTIIAPNEATARARADRIRARINALVSAGEPAQAAALLHDAASARTERAFAEIERAMRDLAVAAQAAPPQTGPRTFGEVLDFWLSGELRRRWPQACEAKGEASVRGTRGMYAKVIYPILGTKRVEEITKGDAQDVVQAVAHLAQSTRRRYETLVRLVLGFAVDPLELIPRSPITKGFVEPEGDLPAFGFLYPEEEAALIGDTTTDEDERALYAFTARNGLRISEACAAVWGDVDFHQRTFTLNRNKTGRPRWWVMDEDVVRALTLIREGRRERGEEAGDAHPIFPGVTYSHIARQFRSRLVGAGVTRRDLHSPVGMRRRIRVHDLRATFCTLAIASGRGAPTPERWVRKRTGHSMQILERYVREAESVRDLGLGWLVPMDTGLKLGALDVDPSYVPACEKTLEVFSDCSDEVREVGQAVGHSPPFQPKKAPMGNPARFPRGALEEPHAPQIPGETAGSNTSPPGRLHDGPPKKGGLGQIDPVADRVLRDAIEKARAAGDASTARTLANVLGELLTETVAASLSANGA